MLITFALPPGVYRNGTVRQSSGRWYGSHLTRQREGITQPIGGWQAHSASTVTGAARGIIAWIDTAKNRWIGIGTHSHLYAMSRAGVLSDITPVGFTPGRADAGTAGGYGSGTYGSGPYGAPRPSIGLVQDATVWALDTFGEALIACNADDGFMYNWDQVAADPATKVTNAPTNNRGCLVTEEGFLVALGAGGDARVVEWCDQEDSSLWAPDPTNQAGSLPLQTVGRLMQGVRTRGAHLLLTDADVWVGSYQGPPLVYGYERVGEGCGSCSQASAVAGGNLVAWMGHREFWTYNGATVQPLPCDVADAVFSDINPTQISKVFAKHNPEFGEIEWCYPSSSSTEVDTYVTWNYRENHWDIGEISRTCGVSQGAAFDVPLMVGTDGTVWEHESGSLYPGAASPYIESGPLEWPAASGLGDDVMTILGLVPDEGDEGQWEATFYARMYPNGPETTYGPYDLTNKSRNGQVDFRFSAREVRMRLTLAAATDARAGVFQLNVASRGKA